MSAVAKFRSPKGKGTAHPPLKAILPLVRWMPDRRMPIMQRIHILYVLLPYIAITLPIQIVVKHIIPLLTLGLWKSGIKRDVGRWAISDFIARQTTRILCYLNPQQARAMFYSRTWTYSLVYNLPFFWGYKSYLRYVAEPGVQGKWLAKPGTNPKDDEIVFYFVHGGGFIADTGAPAQLYFLYLLKTMHARGRRFSIFQLDYELAPEYVFPSQTIEAHAGYSYLVHKLGIDPNKIVIGGDSAGANIVMSLLLHLARPSKEIGELIGEKGDGDAWLGKLSWNKSSRRRDLKLSKPKGVFLMSPFHSFVSDSPTQKKYRDYDFVIPATLLPAALCYVGAVPQPGPSYTFNPIIHFRPPYTPLHVEVPGIGRLVAADTRAKGGRGQKKERDLEKRLLTEGMRVLATNPYVDPGLIGKGGVGKGKSEEERKKDEKEWWKEALPGDGKTIVTWGGREVMSGEQERLTKVWEEAGLAPVRLVKDYGVHDWILYDYAIPFVYKTRSKSSDPQSSLWYGTEKSADWFEQIFPAKGKGKSKSDDMNGSWVSVK